MVADGRGYEWGRFLERATDAAQGTDLDAVWLAGYYAWREERGLNDRIATLVFGPVGPSSPWWGSLDVT